MEQDQENLSRTVGAMRKNGKLWVALLGVAVGVVLLLFGGEWASVFMKDDSKGSVSDRSDATEDGLQEISMEAYRTALEARIRELCGRVSGAGEVYVMVNLAGGYEYVYATDQKTTQSGTAYEYIMLGSGDEERVVYLTERVPEILGIGVVCTGGNDPTVRNEITALLSASLGVGSHKVYVTGGR